MPENIQDRLSQLCYIEQTSKQKPMLYNSLSLHYVDDPEVMLVLKEIDIYSVWIENKTLKSMRGLRCVTSEILKICLLCIHIYIMPQ